MERSSNTKKSYQWLALTALTFLGTTELYAYWYYTDPERLITQRSVSNTPQSPRNNPPLPAGIPPKPTISPIPSPEVSNLITNPHTADITLNGAKPNISATDLEFRNISSN